MGRKTLYTNHNNSRNQPSNSFSHYAPSDSCFQQGEVGLAGKRVVGCASFIISSSYSDIPSPAVSPNGLLK